MAEERDWHNGETALSVRHGVPVARSFRRRPRWRADVDLRAANGRWTFSKTSPPCSERGVPSGTLMRQWIVERLALERQRPPVASDAVWAAAMEGLPLAEDIAARLAGRRSA